MRVISNFLVSILLTTIISFAVPALVIGLFFTILLVLGYIPGLSFLGQGGIVQISDFLAVFGSGNPFEGVIILGLAFALVGFFFDIFTFYFYRYQGLRS